MKARHKGPRLPPGGIVDPVAKVLGAGGRVPKKFVKARPVSAGPTLGAMEALAKITPARRMAFEILTLVESGTGHSDDLLRSPRMDRLSEPDRHLATALVMGVLRWQIALDARVARLLQRRDRALAEPVAIALRMGAFQLLHMDRIPAHAALSESVELCRAAGHPHATGMVNAILRQMVREQPASLALDGDHPELRPIFERAELFAERLGHPAWLVERWRKEYGREAALRICEADQAEPGRGGLFGDASEQEHLPHIDDGSRLVAELAAAALPSVEGRAPRVWDCCAAPGGKTLMLAKRLPGAEILASDVNAKRIAAMKGRLRQFDFASGVRTAVLDATKLPEAAGDFDLILCDVPCSGTGTLGRNPEIRLRLQPSELALQAERQRAILGAALKRLALGGRLVYSTCSLEPEENEAVVSAVAGDWRRVSVGDLLSKVSISDSSMVRNKALRTLPGAQPCDGFFAVVVERT